VRFGYGLNYLIDIENAVIIDEEATPFRAYDEFAATKTMIQAHWPSSPDPWRYGQTLISAARILDRAANNESPSAAATTNIA